MVAKLVWPDRRALRFGGPKKKLGAEGEKFLLYECRRTKVPWYWIEALGERTCTWTMLRFAHILYDAIIRTRVFSSSSLSPYQYLLPALNGFLSERHPVACRPGPRSRHVSACQWGNQGGFGAYAGAGGIKSVYDVLIVKDLCNLSSKLDCRSNRAGDTHNL